MRAKGVTVLATLAAAVVSGGWLLERGARAPGVVTQAQGQRLLQQVVDHVSRDFVDTLSADSIDRKLAAGLLRELHDPHSVFLTPERYRRLNESTTGLYAGLGVQIDVRDGWITVIAPVPGGPAAQSGIESGDRIVEIDGRSTRGLTGDEATKVLRGLPGSIAKLVVERPGVAAHMPFTVQRRTIHLRAVQRATMLDGDVGYVEVGIFSDSTTSELRASIDSLSRAGMKSLVLDLRGNPGGLLEQGVEVAELFLDPGKAIVRMRGRTPEANHEFFDRQPQRWAKLPIVALVDEGSASASEIVAGALQDHDRAAIVGVPSYGKGSAQSIFPIRGEGAVKLTTALWYTPSGRSINRRPIDVDADEADDGDDEVTTAADSLAARRKEKFHTDAGRTVYGGGGITPDVIVHDSVLGASEQEVEQSLGEQVPKFRDALTDYALALKGQRAVRDPGFTITPQMREELWRRMTARGIAMPRAVYDRNAALVDRALGNEIARFVFGGEGELRRGLRDDPVLSTAATIARRVRDQRDLLQRADSARVAIERAERLAPRDSATR